MKIAVFSDVHGNLVNLKSFYNSALDLDVQEFICLGDLCNYYTDNREVIDFIKNKDIKCLLGNHDELYISENKLSAEKKAAYSFEEDLLQSAASITFLKSLPIKYETKILGNSILFCHASPNDFLHEYIYPDTDLKIYKNCVYDFVFMGHSHRQFLRSEFGKTFCNVGSIGLPRDNGSLMGFAVFDTRNLSITLYRKKIDCREIKHVYQDKVNPEVIKLLDRDEKIKYKYSLINE